MSQTDLIYNDDQPEVDRGIMEDIRLIHGDCIEEMAKLEDNSIDMCLTDPPYGTTNCKWDSVIPFEPMWGQLKRIVKPNGAICLFGQNPFTAALISSNFKQYKFDWVWNKVRGTGFQVAKYRPMVQTEYISIFGHGRLNYYPIMEKRTKVKRSKCYKPSDSNPLKYNDGKVREYTHRNPKNLLTESSANQKGKLAPTQKPVPLLKYLIKTYTLENETVLDFTFGSGSTGVACKNLGRKFIGIEKEKKYYDIAVRRISEADQL